MCEGQRSDETERQHYPGDLQSVVQAYLQPVLRAAQVACLDQSLAEDLTQATFAAFIENPDRFEGRSHIRTWLFAILYNKVAEAKRKRFREVQAESIEALVDRRFNERGSWMRPPRPVDQQLYNSEIRTILQNCLRAAPVAQRMAFVLREVEGQNTAEICEILGVTPSNLGSMLCRVRNRLRECLEEKGVRSQ